METRSTTTASIREAVGQLSTGRTFRLALAGQAGPDRRDAVDTGRSLAAHAGADVLTVHGRPGDADLPFSSMLTLLGQVDGRLDDLTEDESSSLRAAAELRVDDVDPRAVRTGLWHLLGRIAADGPVVLLVHDSEHVDPVTAEVLAFALGRLDTEPLVGLIAVEPAVDHPLARICDRIVELEAGGEPPADEVPLGHWLGQGRIDAVAEHLAAPHDGSVTTFVGRSAAARWLGGETAAVPELRAAAAVATAEERPEIDALFADAALASGQARTCLEVAAGVIRQTSEGPAAELAGALLVLTGKVDPQPFLDHEPAELDANAGPLEVRGIVRRAEVQIRFGELEAAARTLGGLTAGAVAWDPAETAALRARVLSLRGEPLAAAQLLEQVLDGLPTQAVIARAVVAHEQAEARFLTGDVEDAIAALDQVIPLFGRLRMSRREAAARLTAGRLAWAMGREENGLANLAQARRLDPTGPIDDLVAALLESGRERDARAWFEAAADGPTRWRTPVGLLRAHANLADTPDALGELAGRLRADGLTVPLAEVLIDQAAWHHRRAGWSGVWETVESAIRVVIPLGLAGWVPRLDRLEPPRQTSPEAAVPTVLEPLTSAERRVALAVSRGLTNKAAAEELYLSVKTVDSHLQRIYPKLGVRSRGELAAAVHGSADEQQRSA